EREVACLERRAHRPAPELVEDEAATEDLAAHLRGDVGRDARVRSVEDALELEDRRDLRRRDEAELDEDLPDRSLLGARALLTERLFELGRRDEPPLDSDFAEEVRAHSASALGSAPGVGVALVPLAAVAVAEDGLEL